MDVEWIYFVSMLERKRRREIMGVIGVSPAGFTPEGLTTRGLRMSGRPGRGHRM